MIAAMKVKTVWLLGLLFLGMGVFWRIWQLNEVPNGLNRDEIVMGYDAYSLLMTGRDQWGAVWPFFFRGLDGYQPGIFPYTTLVWVTLLGPIDWAIRLTPFFYGTLTLITTFFLARRIFNSSPIGLIALFLLAISPWHLMYCRLANPNVLLPFFHTLFLLIFFKWVDTKQPRYLYLFALALGLSFHSYYVSYFFVPLSCLGLLLFFFKDFWKQKWHALGAFALFFPFVMPHIYHALYGEILSRGSLLVFNAPNLTFWERVAHLFENSLFFFSFEFLFDKGVRVGGEWFSEHGILYWFELPLLLAGLWGIIRSKNRKAWFLLWWLLIYPLPSSITIDNVNQTLRTSVAIPIFQLVGALGAWQLLKWLNALLPVQVVWKRWARVAVSLVCAGIVIASVSEASRKYFKRYPYRYAHLSQYGLKEMVNYIRDKIDDYDRIVITGHVSDPARRRPILFLAYYLPLDPAQYQVGEKSLVHESVVARYGKFEVNYRHNARRPEPGERVLYVVRETECAKAKVLHRIFYPNGEVVYKICEFVDS